MYLGISPAQRYFRHGKNCCPTTFAGPRARVHTPTHPPLAVKEYIYIYIYIYAYVAPTSYSSFQELSFLNSLSLLSQSRVHNRMCLSRIFLWHVQKTCASFSKVWSPLAGGISQSEELGTTPQTCTQPAHSLEILAVCTALIGFIVYIWA